MDYQIIDSDNYETSGIETLVFPGGEPHVKFHKPIQDKGILFLKLRSWTDVGFASLIIDSIAYAKKDKWRAFIPYYPAARQDRRTSLLSPLTVYNVYSILHSHFLMTWTFDPHSKVLSSKLEPRYFMPSNLNISNTFNNVTGIIAPDSGATNRAKDFFNKYCPNADFYQATKIRNPDTGELSNYQLPQLENAGRYIIIDDICDGGGTFNLLAAEFKKQFANSNNLSLELFVSHGIFSKGVDNLDPIIKHVYTTDSWCQLKSDDRLTIFTLNQKIIFDQIMSYYEE